MDYKIIYEDDSELSDFEALNKGFRRDVVLLVGQKIIRLYIVDFVRFCQDYEEEMQNDGFYIDEPNTIIVPEVTKTVIEHKISKLYQLGFFSECI